MRTKLGEVKVAAGFPSLDQLPLSYQMFFSVRRLQRGQRQTGGTWCSILVWNRSCAACFMRKTKMSSSTNTKDKMVSCCWFNEVILCVSVFECGRLFASLIAALKSLGIYQKVFIWIAKSCGLCFPSNWVKRSCEILSTFRMWWHYRCRVFVLIRRPCAE